MFCVCHKHDWDLKLCIPVSVHVGGENVSYAECIESDLKRTAKIPSAAGEACIVKQ